MITESQEDDSQVLVQRLKSSSASHHNQLVNFRGLNFDFSVSRVIAINPDAYTEDDMNLCGFLEVLDAYGLLNDKDRISKIVFADDQYINQRQFRMQLQQLGYDHEVFVFSNGQQVINYFTKLIDAKKEELWDGPK